MKLIDFSPDLLIPVSVTTQKLAFLGISGSGKTYGAGKLVEGVIDAGGQVVIVDSIGNWFGLRLAADGKGAGLSIPVLGGDRGDVALDPTAGKQTAELVVETSASMIVDVSDFGVAEGRRFVTAFAASLLSLKKKKPGPVLVVWEECQDFVPQRVMGDSAHCLGAMERLIKKGRNYGVGTVLISQRPAAVNKDVLNQIETLFCFRMNAPQDRSAIKNWIVENGLDTAALLGELPKLPTGTAFCWSPEFLDIFAKVRVGKKRTFNASATPEFGKDAIKAGALAPVDLERFKKTMASVIEQTKDNDPAELKKRLGLAGSAKLALETQVARLEGLITTGSRELNAQVAELTHQLEVARATPPAPSIDIAGAIVAGLEHTIVNEIGERFADAQRRLASVHGSFNKTMTTAHEQGRLDKARRERVAYGMAPGSSPLTPGAHKVTVDRVRVNGNGIDVLLKPKGSYTISAIGGGAHRMLQMLASRDPAPTTRVQLATLAGLKHTSGTFSTYLSQLNTAGFISKGDRGFQITTLGLKYLGDDYSCAPSGDELIQLWQSKLTGAAKDMLLVIVNSGPRGISREKLAESVELSAGSGTFSTYLSKLNSNGLITKRDGLFFAAEDFR